MAVNHPWSIRLEKRRLLASLGVLAFFALAVGLPLETTSHADQETAAAPTPLKLSGMWTGEYHYPEGSSIRPVAFSALIVQRGNKLIGEITEFNTFGDQDQPWLHATLIGTIDPGSSEIQFTKKYDGTAGQGHEVLYTGHASAHASQIDDGMWKIPQSLQGTFKLKKKGHLDSKPRESLERTAGLWKGEYQYPAASATKPVAFMLVLVSDGDRLAGEITEANTFGDARNAPWLHARVEAQVDPETNTLRFLKTYDGTGKVDHEVRYEGKLSGDFTTVKQGTWKIDDAAQGTFSIKKESDD